MDESQTLSGRTIERRRFPWFFAAIVALCTGAISFAHLWPNQDPGQSNLITNASIGVTGLAAVIFVARRRSLPRALRFAPLVLVFLGVAVFFSLYRFVGWTSTLQPLFVWRWADRSLIPLNADQAENQGDITKVMAVATTPYDFPGFLGPTRDQEIKSVRLDRDWQAHPPQQIWRHAIGAGWSGFAVVADYAVTQEQRDEQELVVCYDLKSGESRWAHANDVRFGTEGSFGGVGPRATPTIHNGRVFTVGASGILNCIELATGRPLWSKDIRQDNGAENVFWGTACSPLVVDDLIVVSAGGAGGKSLVAYQQVDGARAWSGGDDFSSYASPSLATLCGIRQILMVNQDWVAGHDAENGRVLWRFEWPGKTDRNANTSQARPIGDNRVVISKGYTQGAALFELDAGKVRQARKTGEPAEAKRLWDRTTTKKTVLRTKHSNVCIYGDYAYGLDETVLQCVAIATGKERWRSGRYGQGQLLLIDDLLLVQAEDGRVLLVEANPAEHVELASFQAIEGEPCWNCPALAGPYLIVRNKYEAACYKLPLAE
jgi:outer membrane protein assembly factor BamB